MSLFLFQENNIVFFLFLPCIYLSLQNCCSYIFEYDLYNTMYTSLQLSFIFMFLQLWPIYINLTDTPPTHNTSRPVVKHEFSRRNGFIPHQFSNFKCVFPFLSSPNPNETLLYQIYWYINGDTVFVTNAVKEEDFTRTLLNEDNGITRMGIQVCFIQINKCVYWLRFT